MNSSSSVTPDRNRLPDAPTPDLLIRNWPLVDSPRLRYLVVPLTVAVFVVAVRQSNSWAMAGLATVCLAAVMWRFWLPILFHFRSRGIEQTCCGRRRLIPWRCIRDYHLQKRGVVLRCHFRDGRIPDEQALYIQWHDQRREVLEAIAFYCRGMN